MAMGLNEVKLVGTLTKEAELKYTPNGLAVLEFALAGDDRVVTHGGEVRELPWYHRVVVYGVTAERLVNRLVVGSAVFVLGALNYRTWETEAKVRRSALDVKALRVEILSAGQVGLERSVTDSKGQPRLRGAVNAVTLIGNLTKDAELRQTVSQVPLVRLGVAINERFKDKQGHDKEKVHFVEVELWREAALATASLTKGQGVFVTGWLANHSWRDEQDALHYLTVVEAERLECLYRPDREDKGVIHLTPDEESHLPF
jgi:single-strand DNA-binding protein